MDTQRDRTDPEYHGEWSMTTICEYGNPVLTPCRKNVLECVLETLPRTGSENPHG